MQKKIEHHFPDYRVNSGTYLEILKRMILYPSFLKGTEYDYSRGPIRIVPLGSPIFQKGHCESGLSEIIGYSPKSDLDENEQPLYNMLKVLCDSFGREFEWSKAIYRRLDAHSNYEASKGYRDKSRYYAQNILVYFGSYLLLNQNRYNLWHYLNHMNRIALQFNVDWLEPRMIVEMFLFANQTSYRFKPAKNYHLDMKQWIYVNEEFYHAVPIANLGPTDTHGSITFLSYPWVQRSWKFQKVVKVRRHHQLFYKISLFDFLGAAYLNSDHGKWFMYKHEIRDMIAWLVRNHKRILKPSPSTSNEMTNAFIASLRKLQLRIIEVNDKAKLRFWCERRISDKELIEPKHIKNWSIAAQGGHKYQMRNLLQIERHSFRLRGS